MATEDKIKALKEKLKEAKALEKSNRAGKTETEKQFKDDGEKESAKEYINAVKEWTKSVLLIGKLTAKIDELSDVQADKEVE